MACRIAEGSLAITQEGVLKVKEGPNLDGESSICAHRSVAISSPIAQDRLDLSMSTRVLARLTSQPTEGVEVGIKRAIRYLQKDSRAAINLVIDLPLEEVSI